MSEQTASAGYIPAPKVSMQTKLSYGFGAFGKDFSLNLVNTFLFFYLTDVANVDAGWVGFIFLIARVWDTINDPIFGYLVAKSNSRWGKYKPWIFVGNIFNAVFMVACFCTHFFEGSPTLQLIYLAVVYICWGMAYTICDAPFWSLIPAITMDKDEREGLLPYPRFAATGGSYLCSTFGLPLIAIFATAFAGYTPNALTTTDAAAVAADGAATLKPAVNFAYAWGYVLFAAVGGIFAIASAWVTCKWVEENYEPAPADDFNIKTALSIVVKNSQFLVFLALALSFNLGNGLVGSMLLYFAKYVLHNQDLFSYFKGAGLVCVILSLICFKPLVNVLGRKLIFSLAISFPCLSCLILTAAAFGFTPVGATVVVAGIVTGFSDALYWLLVMIMVADTVDYGDMKFGVRSESIYYSLHTLLTKCSGAISAFVIGIFLNAINYVPDQALQDHSDTWNYMILLTVVPSFLCVLGMLIYLVAYKLNGEELDKVQRVLMRRYMDSLVANAVKSNEEQK